MLSTTGAPAISFGELPMRLMDAINIKINPAAAINMPMPILRGDEGSCPFLFNQAKTPITNGVNATMNSGLKDWKTSGEIAFCGICKPDRR